MAERTDILVTDSGDEWPNGPSRRESKTRSGVERMDRDRERRRADILSVLGPQGTLTGGADIIWVAGSSLLWSLFLRTRQATGTDMAWAALSGALGGLLAMQLAGVQQTTTLRNVSFGITSGAAAYIASRL